MSNQKGAAAPAANDTTYAKKTPVMDMMNMAETIRKENSHAQIYEKFNINPSRLAIYAEKPNLMSPAHSHKLQTEKDFEIDLDDELKSKLTRYTHTPKQKYFYP
mmetsp:Transcript_29432/g.26863  ORF Transcript_29432/g.26863 Transcript_29432/m.26863 type:complete len:104 (+) Transcript_29432:18-329(+)